MRKQNKKALYESIMKAISKEVKKALNENTSHQRTIVNTKDELLDLMCNTISREGPDCDLNWIDVSNITDMSNLCGEYETRNFNGDISEWDVSNVTNMASMFENSKFNGDISEWDVSNVTNMQYMFANSNFNGDISEWDVSNVIDMEGMFERSVFNGDISNWNISNVRNMVSMFAGSRFHQNISKWHITKYFAANIYSRDMEDPEAVNISYMFTECPIKPEYKPYVFPKPRR